MAEVFNHTFDSDLTEWSATVTDSGDLAWASGAGLGGTSGGQSHTLDDTTAIYGQQNSLTAPSTDYRYRFYWKDVSLTMGASDAFDLMWYHTSGTFGSYLQVVNVTGTKTLRAGLRIDGGTFSTGTVAIGAEAAYEVHVQKAATNSSADAFLKVYKDGNYVTPVINITGIDLFDDWAVPLTQFRMGANGGLDAGTSGVFYLDEIVLRNDATQIGLNNVDPVLTVPGAQRYLIGVAEVISGISFTDADDNESVMTFTCNKGTFAAPTPTNVDVTGSGTASMTLTGTRTELNAYCAAGNGPTYTHSALNHDADTITVNIDDQVGTPDEDTIAVTAIDWRMTADNETDLNATFQNLKLLETTAKTAVLTLYAKDSGNRTDTAQTSIVFSEQAVGATVAQRSSLDLGIHV